MACCRASTRGRAATGLSERLHHADVHRVGRRTSGSRLVDGDDKYDDYEFWQREGWWKRCKEALLAVLSVLTALADTGRVEAQAGCCQLLAVRYRCPSLLGVAAFVSCPPRHQPSHRQPSSRPLASRRVRRRVHD